MINGLSGSSNSLFIQRLFQNNQIQLNKNIQKLSSGMRITQAADDAAGSAMLQRINSLVQGSGQATQNLQDAYSVAQVAEGGLQEISNIQNRLKELAVQASNGTLTDQDRALIQEEANNLVSEVDRAANSITFNNQQIFSGEYAAGTGEFETQAGANPGEEINVNFEKVNAAELGLNNIDLTNQQNAENAIQSIDQSITTLTSQRANIGTFQNRVESAINFSEIQNTNMAAAGSRIGDTNYASEMINYVKNSLLQNVNTAMMAQGNLINSTVFSLTG